MVRWWVLDFWRGKAHLYLCPCGGRGLGITQDQVDQLEESVLLDFPLRFEPKFLLREGEGKAVAGKQGAVHSYLLLL